MSTYLQRIAARTSTAAHHPQASRASRPQPVLLPQPSPFGAPPNLGPEPLVPAAAMGFAESPIPPGSRQHVRELESDPPRLSAQPPAPSQSRAIQLPHSPLAPPLPPPRTTATELAPRKSVATRDPEPLRPRPQPPAPDSPHPLPPPAPLPAPALAAPESMATAPAPPPEAIPPTPRDREREPPLVPAAESRAARPSNPPAFTPHTVAPTAAEAAALARIDALLRPHPMPTETTAPPMREPGTQVSIGKVRVEIIAAAPTPLPGPAPHVAVRRARPPSSLGPMSPKLRFGLGQL